MPVPAVPPLTATPSPPIAERDETLRLAGGRTLDARIYGERKGLRCGAAAAQPLVLHLHGGRFVSGGLDSGACMSRLVAGAGAVVVSIDYPLAPAEPFPAAVEAAHAALEVIARRRTRLAGEGATLWLAGEEAGGNLAAAVAMMARDRGGPALAGQILLSPMLDTCLGTASARDAHVGEGDCLWAEGWRCYLSRPDDALHPYAAPGRSLRLAGLPPTLLITAGDDPLRDETRAYAARLGAAGVAVRFARLGGETGWPVTYETGADAEADCRAWAEALRGHLKDFLSPSFLQTAPAAVADPDSESSRPERSPR